MHAAERKSRKILAPVIEDRLQKYAQFGDDWEGKLVSVTRPYSPALFIDLAQNDLISWLIESAPVESRNVKDITIKVMLMNFASIHTTNLV